MRLNPYILALYFSSPTGSELVESFAETLGIELADEEGADEPEDLPQEDLAEHQGDDSPSSESSSEDDIDESDDEENPSSVEIRMNRVDTVVGVLPSCFSYVTGCLIRRWKDEGFAPPASPKEARELYLRLFRNGVVLTKSDLESTEQAIARLEALVAEDDDDGDSSERESESKLSEPPSSLDDVPADWSQHLGGTDRRAQREWVHHIPAISWAFHEVAPESFVPYGFAQQFDLFVSICEEFGIPLPPPPGKNSIEERATYYLDINEALQEFRARHEMNPLEFDAFLYDFAVKAVKSQDSKDLPPAQRIWLLLASPEGDSEFLDDPGDDPDHFWQGNLDTRPGDICVMWCRSPRAYVHSIWRATCRGFQDPFFHYNDMIRIAQPIRVPPVRFAELKANPVWSKKPAVRAHFQNCCGKEVTLEEYDALKAILRKKGFDTSTLPIVETPSWARPRGIEIERDVEEKLFEPLLTRLGYEPKHWVRQLPLRMGRGERVYPDYAFGVEGQYGEERARLVAEAKLHILGERGLRATFIQARSYGERLVAHAVVLVSLEGIWFFPRSGGHLAIAAHQHFSWKDLEEVAVFRRLEDAIGLRSALWKDLAGRRPLS